MLSQKIIEYEIASETIFGSIRCFSEARQQVHMTLYKYLPFLPIVLYSTGFSFLIVCLILQAMPETNCLLGRMESCWKTWKSFYALFAAISQVSTCHLCPWGPCMGVRWAMVLIGNAKQATSEGKSGPVETGLTELVATTLSILLSVKN